MTLKQIIGLAFQISIMCTLFGFGLRATTGDLLYLVRRPGLFARSLLAVFVIMPVVVFALTRVFTFLPTVEVALIALAISPVPPMLPQQGSKAGGHAAFGLGLMAWLSLVSIVAVPVALALLERFTGQHLAMSATAIAGVLLKGALVPLAIGMAVRAWQPAIAARLEKPVTLVAKTLLPLATLAMVFGSVAALWALIGDGSILAIVIFTVAGLAIGHILGGPSPDHAVDLALATACRHPAIAFSIAAANFPDESFGATILLYLLVSAVASAPYLAWHRRQTTEAGAVLV